ncbi:MAG: hypothetical protein ACPGXK_13380 [Phycisphaerae bacterium]
MNYERQLEDGVIRGRLLSAQSPQPTSRGGGGQESEVGHSTGKTNSNGGVRFARAYRAVDPLDPVRTYLDPKEIYLA